MDQETEVEELQATLDRSWELARQANDRPGFRAALEASVYDVHDLSPGTREAMLAARRDPLFQDWVTEQAARFSARDLDAFYEWVERDKPKMLVEALVARFILHIARSPWAAPSEPEELLSDRPRSEARKAFLSFYGGNVYLLYRQHFELDGALVDEPVVDLLALSLV